MNKKLVFDTVRPWLDAQGFTPDRIEALDRALDGQEAPQSSYVLGRLSEQYESGGKGPGTVSSGVGDPGGVSYGTYQLASKTGTAGAFVASDGVRWKNELSAMPGSSSFSVAWKAIAAREPDLFGAAQHAFIERTHYAPAVAAVKLATGFDYDSRANAVRDAVWSISVQHGRAVRILTNALALPGAKDSDKALVNALYDARTAYVSKLAETAAPGDKRTFLSLINNRYPDERKRALEMFA